MPTATGPTTTTVLRDGERIDLHDVRPDDEGALLALLEHVTGDARWMRFFTGGADLRTAAHLAVDVDGARRFGLLVTTADARVVLGHGMVVPAGDDTAEVAFEVADGHHRRGIGTLLLRELAARARTAGYRTLVAEVLPVNRDMLDMLDDSGLPVTARRDGGIVHATIAVDSSFPGTEG